MTVLRRVTAIIVFLLLLPLTVATFLTGFFVCIIFGLFYYIATGKDPMLSDFIENVMDYSLIWSGLICGKIGNNNA